MHIWLLAIPYSRLYAVLLSSPCGGLNHLRSIEWAKNSGSFLEDHIFLNELTSKIMFFSMSQVHAHWRNMLENLWWLNFQDHVFLNELGSCSLVKHAWKVVVDEFATGEYHLGMKIIIHDEWVGKQGFKSFLV